jgi:orotate phosphoribosyltransferase
MSTEGEGSGDATSGRRGRPLDGRKAVFRRRCDLIVAEGRCLESFESAVPGVAVQWGPMHGALVDHLRRHALRQGGPFRLRSGGETDWYVDARRTTFDGEGALLTGRAVLRAIDPGVTAVGGLTMGADPIAVATALVAATEGRRVSAFSVRKTEKDHGTGGRIVGPVLAGDRIAVVEDTTTTGGAIVEAIDVLTAAGFAVSEALALVDRSGGAVGARLAERGIPYRALVEPADLGVSR